MRGQSRCRGEILGEAILDDKRAQERLHDALVLERNSLRRQSLEHPDGWGIASWHDGGPPQVARGLGAAHLDPEFERISSAVQARTVARRSRASSTRSAGATSVRFKKLSSME